MVVVTEDGYQAALIWGVGDAFTLPITREQPETSPESERI